MANEPHLTKVIREMLEHLLLDEIRRHVPDDDRIGILNAEYRIEHRPSRYTGVNYELPVFERPLSGGGTQSIMLGPKGGVHVITIFGKTQNLGIWRDGQFDELVAFPLEPDS